MRRTRKDGRKEKRKEKKRKNREGFEEDKERWVKGRKEGKRYVSIRNDLRKTWKDG